MKACALFVKGKNDHQLPATHLIFFLVQYSFWNTNLLDLCTAVYSSMFIYTTVPGGQRCGGGSVPEFNETSERI